MAVFDPTTAYKDDWQYKPFIESVTWEYTDADGQDVTVTGLKAQFGDAGTSDLQSAGELSATSQVAGVVVWQPETEQDGEPTVPFAPVHGQVLRREAKSNEGWVIVSVGASRFGHWELVCQREVENA